MSLRRKLSTGAALLAAAATLAGGIGAAPVALAEDGIMPMGGDGGNAGGGMVIGGGAGGDAYYLSWRYRDNNDGGFGPATNPASTRTALDLDWKSYGGDADKWIGDATTQANTNCLARFDEAHPDQKGQGKCRVVAVGAAGRDSDRLFGHPGGTIHSNWMKAWHDTVDGVQFSNNGVTYNTASAFSDQSGNVDDIADKWAPDYDLATGESTGTIVVIALNQYEPPLADYGLSVSTNATSRTTHAGDTNPIADDIILDNAGSSIVEDVTGTISAHWTGVDGTSRQADKRFTAANNGRTNVQFAYTDLDGGWKAWPAGHIWFDVAVPKQGKMKADASHMGADDPAENWRPTNVPPVKSLWNAAGQRVAAPDDRIASGSLYTARVEAQSSASGRFWIYDVIDTRDVWIGAADHDDFGQVRVEGPDGNTVAADISVDDGAIAGKRVVRAHVTNPTSGRYTLVVPQAARPTGADYVIRDGSIACWNGDNGTGSMADCQQGNGGEVGKVTPRPNKVWVLDGDGALKAEDPDWTNQAGSDQKTFVPGDPIAAVVNGILPAHLLNPFGSYTIADDWSGSADWIDWTDQSKVKVYVDGKDRTGDFDISIDTKNHVTTAIAKDAILRETMLKNAGTPVKLVIGGTIKPSDTANLDTKLTNGGWEKWNNEQQPTNDPPVFLRTPDPNKVWSRDQAEADQAEDTGKTNDKAADTLTFVQGDTVWTTVNGTLPQNLARNLSKYELGDDWTAGATWADLSDTKGVKVTIDGQDRTGDFDIHNDGTRTWVSAKSGLLDSTAGQGADRKVRVTIAGKLRDGVLKPGQTVDIPNTGWETWSETTIPANTPVIHEWTPNPDKAWVLQQDGKWQMVIDPDHTNKVGADNLKFKDGETVGSVVNGTIAANLAKIDGDITLVDDWADADYIFDGPTDPSQIRVYEADTDTDAKSSVADIADHGTDVTDQWDIKIEGTKVTATAKKDHVASMVGLAKPRQITLLIPGKVNYANGGGVPQVRKDFGLGDSDEITFCTNPADGGDSGRDLSNKGSQSVTNTTEKTNEPRICGWVPPTPKQVIAEGSEGGDQGDANGKVVTPGQKVEYRLTTRPDIPSDMAYDITYVAITDTYDQWLIPDKQTLEIENLDADAPITTADYNTSWDDKAHQFTVEFSSEWVKAHWAKGSNPQVRVRFEGTVDAKAPTTIKVGNTYKLIINNEVVPSNRVENESCDENCTPDKQVTQSKEQGDPSIDVDGKTMLKGDTGRYKITLNGRITNTAYKVWRLGIIDDYDEDYLDVDPDDITVISDNGHDVTDRFNVQVKDGVAYVFAKTVDTFVPKTGETIKGDPQPADLKAYSEITEEEHDPLKDPAIDQDLLGHTYEVSMPFTVARVGGTAVNTATQLTNGIRKLTNEVTTPLDELNPDKDVTIKVGGESANGTSIYLHNQFLYRLDSSVLPANRAYPEVKQWGIDDTLDPAYDKATGQWAVYAARDLYQDGKVIAAKGDRIAGTGFDPAKFGGALFTADIQPDNGKVTIEATDLYKGILTADTEHEQAWTAYIQVTRVKVTERHENYFTERYNDKTLKSNIVWTKTPDLTPSISVEKWDEASGADKGDRDDPKDALTIPNGDERKIVFTITNTSKDEDGHGAVYKASDLKLTDETIVGDGKVEDIQYPANWDTLVLRPGESVNLTGTLKGVTGNHTDRAKVTGTPLVECPATDANPFGPTGTTDGDEGTGKDDNGTDGTVQGGQPVDIAIDGTTPQGIYADKDGNTVDGAQDATTVTIAPGKWQVTYTAETGTTPTVSGTIYGGTVDVDGKVVGTGKTADVNVRDKADTTDNQDVPDIQEITIPQGGYGWFLGGAASKGTVHLTPVSLDTTDGGTTADGQDQAGQDQTTDANAGRTTVTVDGRTLCADTPVTSEHDDWNGHTVKVAIDRKTGEALPNTGTPLGGVMLLTAIAILGAGATWATRRHLDTTATTPAHSGK